MIQRRLALLLAVVALSGCNIEKTRNLIDARADQAAQGLREAQKPAAAVSYNPLTVTDKLWAGSSSLRLRRGMPLPSRFEGPHGVTLISGEGMGLSDIAATLTAQTGIPVRVAAGAVSDAGAGASSTGTDGGGSGGAGGMTLAYEGPLSGLLDQVSGNFGVNWRYDGAVINLSRFETRVFMIEALPGTQSVKDGIKEVEANSSSRGGASNNAASTSSLQQTSEMTAEFKVWDELGQTVTSMLGGVGSVVVSPSNGSITVTTTPDVMRTVATYIKQENRRLSRQIAINVEIYKVELSEGTDFGFVFNEALKRLKMFGATFAGPLSGAPAGVALGSGGVSGGGALNIAILNPDTTGQVTGLFQALSTLGDTSRVAQFPMTTLNNRPVSRRVGQDTTYVASIQSNTSTSTTGISNSAITPGVIPEGFSLQVTPRLLDDGRIMMQYSLSIVDIVKIETFGTAPNQVQLPKTTNRVFVQQSLLKSGSTLIIGGFDDEQARQNAQGVGSPFNFFLGGGSNTSTGHTMLFMSVTPQVLDVPTSEQD